MVKAKGVDRLLFLSCAPQLAKSTRGTYNFPMTIAPISADALLQVVERGYKDACQLNKNLVAFSKLSEAQLAQLCQLTRFLSFYLTEELDERLTKEIEPVFVSLKRLLSNKKLKPIETEEACSALAALTQLKIAGLTPGNRIPIDSLQQVVIKGAPVVLRKSPQSRFMVKEWAPDFSEITIENRSTEITATREDLIFIDM